MSATLVSRQTNRFRYNANGQITGVTNALGQWVSLTYSNGYLSEVLSLSTPGSPSVMDATVPAMSRDPFTNGPPAQAGHFCCFC